MKSSNKKVHVLYILTKLELGGAQKVCLSLMDGVKKSGSFSGLISGGEGVLKSEVKKFDSVFLLDSFKREISFKNLFGELKAFFKIIFHVKNLKKKYPNLIVHTHSTKAGLFGRWGALFAGVKGRVHTIHGFSFHEHQNKLFWLILFLLEWFTSLVTTHYVCVSENDRKIGSKLLPRFAKKSSIIRAAVEWEKFYTPATQVKQSFSGAIKTDMHQRPFVIGTVSCFKPQKNLVDLLKAFKKMNDNLVKSNFFKQQNVLLQIVGDGVLREDIQKWIYENKLEKRIELLGWQNNVEKWMKSWDLFVMSSLWEGLPCAIVEARLCRLPVISYKISGIPEIIFDGKNGFLVAPGDWRNLANKIQMIIQDKDLWHKFKNYNDNLIDFKDKIMVQEHLKLYRQLV